MEKETRIGDGVKNKNLGGEKKKMKTKTKTLAVVEIAIVLCSVFLVALLGIAADQTTQKASASEVTASAWPIYEPGPLDIYGNANEDDSIDMGDVVYIKLAIFGKKSKTELCDANYDGKVSMLDVGQTKLIILGKEKELTIIDITGMTVTVKKPVERMAVFDFYAAEAIRAIGAKDKIIGVGRYAAKYPEYYPDLHLKPLIGSGSSPNYEKIIELNTDLVIDYREASTNVIREKLESTDIPVIGLQFYVPPTHFREVRILGFILDKEKEADEYLTLLQSNYDLIEERVGGLKTEEKRTAYYESSKKYRTCGGLGSGYHSLIRMAGGINIFADLPPFCEVSPEAVARRNPDVIIKAGIHGYALTDTIMLEESREEIMNRPELAKVTAVKNGDVYVFSRTILQEGGKYPTGVCYIAKILYPDKFEDLDPNAILKEYLEKYQGLPYQGVYIYPSP
jgi:iron complex transport system substrate-binding protein